jgi:CRISPR-associated protein Csh1
MEDVIPSQISKVVEKMRKEPKLTDLVTLKNREKDKTYLQDFFNRNELYHIVNRSATNNGNSIIKERIYLAKLLLSDLKIDMYDLFYRFHVNRECGYDNNKRLTKEGIKHWIEYPGSFSVSENNVLNFLNELGKIKEN